MESKPIISYEGDEKLFSSLQAGITQQLSVDHVEWRRSFGRAAKTVYVDATFVKFTENIVSKTNEWKLIGETFFHTYWTDCVDLDQYKSSVRDDISNWLTILKNHGVYDWLIVAVETMDGKKGNKAKLLPRTSVIDKIKNDFCSKQQDRCVALLDPLKSDSRGAESWQTLLLRIRQLLLQAYNRHLSKFEEHMRSQRERRNENGWSFCEYFILQEELAFVFEMLGVYHESLVQYDELDALFTQFILNSKVGETPEWLHNFYRTCDSWSGLTLSKPLNDKKHQLIREGKASLLDIRNYLFSRQCSLLLLLYRPWEVAQRTLPFLHNCINELQILEVSLPSGAISCWVFLSCLEILQTCEKFHDSTQVEAYSLYTAGLWAYARDKLRELGVLCGLMPGMKETSDQLHLVVGLLSGLVEEDSKEDKDELSPIRKVKKALSSRDAFQHRYLELSELAMGTFKHIGRIRSARLIGKDLAEFYMQLGEPQKAAAFLTDILKTCLLENWSVLAASTRLSLANCYNLIKDHEKYIKVCAQIAASSCLDEKVRLNHFDQLLSYAKTHVAGNRSVRVWAGDIFDASFISVDSEAELIIRDSCVVISLTITSHFIKEFECSDVEISVIYKNEAKSEHSSSLKNSGQGNRWKSWDQKFDVQLSEQFDYQQDRSLTSVSLVCPNLQTALRRRDSQFGFHREKEIGNEESNERLLYGQVVLKPGKNKLIYKCKARDPGFYLLNKITIKANPLQFVISNVQPSVGYEVVYQAPKLYFQRANKNDLIAGAEQELILKIDIGSCLVEPNMTVELKGSDGLLLRLNESSDSLPYLQAIECPIPIVEPFQTIVIKINVLAETEVAKEANSFERKVAISNPWTKEEHQALLLFLTPFYTIHKLHTVNNRKYIQVTVQGLQADAFEISGHSLTVNCSDIALLPTNPLTQKLIVCKHQNISYVWEMVTNLVDFPPIHLEFQINYQHQPKPAVISKILHTNLYKYRFNLENYKTLFAVRSVVEPVGSEFCRVGSICHMTVTITGGSSTTVMSSLPSLMYEVIADQMTWAVCGRSAGIVSLGVEGSHNTQLDVMPLTRGFLPLPSVRVSRYVTMEQKGSKNIKVETSSYAPNYPRLEPFSPGEIYNWSKSCQVHVLPALGTSTTDSITT